jgi:hypothetical protein
MPFDSNDHRTRDLYGYSGKILRNTRRIRLLFSRGYRIRTSFATSANTKAARNGQPSTLPGTLKNNGGLGTCRHGQICLPKTPTGRPCPPQKAKNAAPTRAHKNG